MLATALLSVLCTLLVLTSHLALAANNSSTISIPARPLIKAPKQFGSSFGFGTFWVEYPSGLIDLTRTHPISSNPALSPPPITSAQLDIAVDGNRTIRVQKNETAIVIIDMQNFFVNPILTGTNSTPGMAAIQPLLDVVPFFRKMDMQVVWLNWGLTNAELDTIPPSLVRSFSNPDGSGGFGSELPDNFGRLLMRDQPNSQLYGPLQSLWLKGQSMGTDVWVHKNRIGGEWGGQTAFDVFLQANGIRTLFFAGVNADQCVYGTLLDAYLKGYDCVIVEDGIATTSPPGALTNVLFNVRNGFGFVSDTERIMA